MLGLGIGEFLLIGAILLVVVGPEKLPTFMRTAGRLYGQVRRASDDLRRAFVIEADRVDAEERYRKLQERRKQAEEDRRKAVESAGEGTVPQEPTLAKPGPAPAPSVPDDDPEIPAPRRPTADAPPPGISPDEWASLPPHVRDMLRQGPGKTGEPTG